MGVDILSVMDLSDLSQLGMNPSKQRSVFWVRYISGLCICYPATLSRPFGLIQSTVSLPFFCG